MNRFKIGCISFITFLIVIASPLFSQSPSTFSPKFSHLSGRYNSDIQLQLTTSTSTATIYYTLDGTEPTTSATALQYVGAIPISGDGTYITVKAVSIDQDTLNPPSVISAGTYIIDYSFNSNSAYLTNLTWAEYSSFIVGEWFGRASTPWTSDYSVRLNILQDGKYQDQTTTATHSQNDYYSPVFYYGVSDPSPLKSLELYDILASGYASGFITIYYGVSTTQEELRYIKFIDDKNLYLEMWKNYQYGPLKYYLTKKENTIPNSVHDQNAERPMLYPNPVSDFLIIENVKGNVQLINQIGQSFMFENSPRLNVTDLPRGLYIVLYTNTNGDLIKEKIVLN
jgi:hypothetical protein